MMLARRGCSERSAESHHAQSSIGGGRLRLTCREHPKQPIEAHLYAQARMLYQIVGTNVYLVPSVHQLPKGSRLPNVFAKLLASAEAVYLERDPAKPLASLPGPPGCLSTTLPESVRAQLEFICNGLFLDPADAEALSPLEAANQISSLRLSQRNWEPMSGVDAQISVDAGAKLRFLESDSDLGVALRSVPLSEQVKELEYVLSDGYLEDVYRVADAWFAGCEDTFNADIEAAWQRAPRLSERLYGDRNRAMASTIMAAIASQSSAMFVVGAGHVYGRNGILAILRSAGRTVVRPSLT